jgi:hypothetical protein
MACIARRQYTTERRKVAGGRLSGATYQKAAKRGYDLLSPSTCLIRLRVHPRRVVLPGVP